MCSADDSSDDELLPTLVNEEEDTDYGPDHSYLYDDLTDSESGDGALETSSCLVQGRKDQISYLQASSVASHPAAPHKPMNRGGTGETPQSFRPRTVPATNDHPTRHQNHNGDDCGDHDGHSTNGSLCSHDPSTSNRFFLLSTKNGPNPQKTPEKIKL